MMKQHSAACERNQQPIADALEDLVGGESLNMLEVSSGTGQHAAFFAERLPNVRFQPTDYSNANFDSISAWTEGLPNVAPPRVLDVLSIPEDLETVDIIFNSNMIHITPPETLPGLMKVAEKTLRQDGLLLIYGPFKVDGAHTSSSNIEFDAWLKDRDSRFGVREFEDAVDAATTVGLMFVERKAMPANNFMLIFRRITSPRQ